MKYARLNAFILTVVTGRTDHFNDPIVGTDDSTKEFYEDPTPHYV